MRKLKVLIACEESQTVCNAFRELGHEAYSNDIKECSGGHPEWHLQMDAVKAIKLHDWDLVIAHPPCTYLSNAGATRLYPKPGVLNPERYSKGIEAKNFFMSIINYCRLNGIPYCIENPTPTRIFALPRYTQVIQPFHYGHPYSKRTCLWLYKVPLLMPTEIVKENIISWVSGGSKDHKGKARRQSGTTFRDSKTRSKTFPGIAKAMAEQWSEYILNKKL